MKRWGVLTIAVIILILFYSWNLSLSQVHPVVEHSKIMQHAEILSSEDLEGRKTSSEGNLGAVKYISSVLSEIVSESNRTDIKVEMESFYAPVQTYKSVPVFEYQTSDGTDRTVELDYGKGFTVVNRPRSGNIDFQGDLLVVTDTIYALEPELLEGKVVVTIMNNVTNQLIDNLIERGASGIINMYTKSFDPTAPVTKEDTELNLRVDWKSGRPFFIGKISEPVFEQLVEEAKFNLIPEHSILDPVVSVGYMREKVTGYIRNASIKAIASYPVIESQNIVVKVKGQSNDSGAVIVSSDIDGYGSELNGTILPSNAQAMTSGTLIELVRMVAESEKKPEKDMYFVFLNASKQGDYGMRAFLSELDTEQRLEWIHLQNFGGVANLPVLLGEADMTSSDRQLALMLRMQLHGQEAGVHTLRGIPSEYAPGYYRLIKMDIPHVILSSGTDKYIAGDKLTDLNIEKTKEITGLLQSYLNRDLLGYDKPDYFSSEQIIYTAILLVIAVLCMYFNKLAKTVPGFEIMGRNIRYWSNTRLFKGLSNTVYFTVPAMTLILFMIFLLLFPKMFVTTEYYGLYSGYSPYLYGKRMIEFTNGLIENGFSFKGQSALDIRILTSLVAGSFKLVIPAMGISILVGLVKGAIDSYKPTDGKNFVSLALLSLPDVLVAFLGLYFIIFWYKSEVFTEFISVDAMRGIVMPVIALSIIPSVYISRLALIAIEEERHKGYVKGILAKGATKWKTYLSHLVPVMMLKILDAMPSVMKLFIANLVIVEYFYAYPGIANYLIINKNSVTIVLLLSMGIGAMYLMFNMVFKVLALAVNPMKRRGI